MKKSYDDISLSMLPKSIGKIFEKPTHDLNEIKNNLHNLLLASLSSTKEFDGMPLETYILHLENSFTRELAKMLERLNVINNSFHLAKNLDQVNVLKAESARQQAEIKRYEVLGRDQINNLKKMVKSNPTAVVKIENDCAEIISEKNVVYTLIKKISK